MNKLLIISGIAAFILACTAQKQAVNIKAGESESLEEDSVEYVLETFDPNFETWYALNNSPSQYHSERYYEGWNQRYVSAWNYNASTSHKNRFFEHIIGYDPTIDYNFELDHKLFYYFLYVENVLKIEIMTGGPKALPF
jgi:hypothetical protein